MNWDLAMRHDLTGEWHLEHHYVREYSNRLAIARDDHQRLTWEEVQAVKEQLWGDVLAIELYPRKAETVNLRHTRHIWRLPQTVEFEVDDICQHPEFHWAQRRAS